MIEMKVRKLLHFSDGNHHLEVDIRIEKGMFMSVYGNSGAGKTTLLRMLAGLTSPDSGSIIADEQIWFSHDKKINIKPQLRNTGFVFQDFALFPNMTVKENLSYALSNKKDISMISELLETTGLKELAARPTYSLSGGQQQRVALARALVRRPGLLLLDEPLSSLDYETRVRLQDEIFRIHKYYKLTTVLISHDKDEIIKLSDRVIKLEQGKVVRQGAPEDLFSTEDKKGRPIMQGLVGRITPVESLTEIQIISGDIVNTVLIESARARAVKAGDQVILYASASDKLSVEKSC